MKPIRIAIVEDDKELLKGISQTLMLSDETEVIGTYTNAEEFIDEVEKVKPEITLMDIGLPRQSGIECMNSLKLVAIIFDL